MNSLIYCLQKWNKNKGTIILCNGSNVIGYNLILGEFYDYDKVYSREVSNYINPKNKTPISNYMDIRNFPIENILTAFLTFSDKPFDWTKYAQLIQDYYSFNPPMFPTFLKVN